MKKIKQLPISVAQPQNSQIESAIAQQDTQALQQIISAAESGLERISQSGRGVYVENLTINVYNDSFNDNSTTEESTSTTSDGDALQGLGFFLLFFGFAVMILGASLAHQPVIIQQSPGVTNHAKS